MNETDVCHQEVCAALARHFPGHAPINRPSMNMIVRAWFATRSCLLLKIHPGPEGWRCTAMVRSLQDGSPWDTDTLYDDPSGPQFVYRDAESVDDAVAMALKALQSVLQEQKQCAELVVRDATRALQELNLSST